MDYLRSCYKSSMRLFRDRPDILTPGRWYFCWPWAKLVPFSHAFGSQNWDAEWQDESPPIGEVKGPRTWVSGKTPAQYTGVGTCGTADAWAHGILYADRPGIPIGADGYPACCPHLPVMEGKLAFDATWQLIPSTPAEMGFAADYVAGSIPVFPTAGELAMAADYLEVLWPVQSGSGALAFEASQDATLPITTPCCASTAPTPSKLKVTLSNTGGRPAWDGRVVPIIYDPVSQHWLSGTFTTGQPFNDPFTIDFFCDGVSWQMVITNGGSASDTNTLTSSVCKPLSVVFTETISTAGGMPATGQTMTVTK